MNRPSGVIPGRGSRLKALLLAGVSAAIEGPLSFGMDLSNQHNLRGPQPDPGTLQFGIRVTMPASDPLRSLLGNDWQKDHWFATREERDQALLDMGKRHAFSRISDTPSIRLEPIDR